MNQVQDSLYKVNQIITSDGKYFVSQCSYDDRVRAWVYAIKISCIGSEIYFTEFGLTEWINDYNYNVSRPPELPEDY